jgi:hypothetical protein
MATALRSEYVDTATRDLRFNPSMESFPANLAPNVQLTYELKPVGWAIYKNLVNGTTTPVFATGDRDIYITSVYMSFVKDVMVTVDGVTISLISMNTTTLTVERGNGMMMFPFPIRVDRNTSITLNSDTNTANFKVRCTLNGFIMSK